MIRHVVFDFDGTLVRSNAIKRRGFYAVTAGIGGAKAALDQLFAKGFRGDRYALFGELARRLADDGCGPDTHALAAEYGRFCHGRIAAAPEVLGARATLDALTAEGVRLFLVSATPQRALDDLVRDRDLARYFPRVLGAPTDKATHLRQIIAEHGITADRIAVVGDGRDDRDVALAVGCPFIAVAGGTAAQAGGGAPPLSDLRDLPPLLGYARAEAGVAIPGGRPRP